MLESVLIAALFAAGALHVLKKRKLWQRVKYVPCEFCLSFWSALLWFIWQDPLTAPALALCAATGAYYLLLRLNYTE